MMNQDFKADFTELVALVKSRKPLTLLRFADGEHAFMTGRKCAGIDGWVSPSGHSRLGEDLQDSIQKGDDRYIFGISCDCCEPSGFGSVKRYLLSQMKTSKYQITFSNIFVNANHGRIRELTEALRDRQVVIITSSTDTEKFADYGFGKVMLVPCPANCGEWGEIRDSLLSYYANTFSKIVGATILIAAGPMAEPIATFLTSFNPTNQYIDIGSALDTTLHNKITRPYQAVPEDHESTCTMSLEGYRQGSKNALRALMDPLSEVTVLINGYKRAETVDRIIESCIGQSVKPADVIVRWNNKAEAEKSLYTKHISSIISSRNTGVWSRFHDAFDCKTKYVCIFDDDTIPGSRWLENCLETIKRKNCLLGTVGLVFTDTDHYMHHTRHGWPNPNEEEVEVDLVGHSWFFKTEWLKLYWSQDRPANLDYAGEDIHFSYALQRFGIKTLVPKHPANEKEFWGSIMGKELGTDVNALSMQTNAYAKWNIPFTFYKQRGWKLKCEQL